MVQLVALLGGFCVVQLVARLGGLLRGVAGGPAGTLLAGAGDDGVVGPACKAGLKVGWPQTGWSEATHKPAGLKSVQTGRPETSRLKASKSLSSLCHCRQTINSTCY